MKKVRKIITFLSNAGLILLFALGFRYFLGFRPRGFLCDFMRFWHSKLVICLFEIFVSIW